MLPRESTAISCSNGMIVGCTIMMIAPCSFRQVHRRDFEAVLSSLLLGGGLAMLGLL